MRHVKPVSHRTHPIMAISLLEWSQIGAVVNTFVEAFGGFVTALGDLFEIAPVNKSGEA